VFDVSLSTGRELEPSATDGSAGSRSSYAVEFDEVRRLTSRCTCGPRCLPVEYTTRTTISELLLWLGVNTLSIWLRTSLDDVPLVWAVLNDLADLRFLVTRKAKAVPAVRPSSSTLIRCG